MEYWYIYNLFQRSKNLLTRSWIRRFFFFRGIWYSRWYYSVSGFEDGSQQFDRWYVWSKKKTAESTVHGSDNLLGVWGKIKFTVGMLNSNKILRTVSITYFMNPWSKTSSETQGPSVLGGENWLPWHQGKMHVLVYNRITDCQIWQKYLIIINMWNYWMY